MLNITLFNGKSLIRELWDYMVEKYFSPELPYMENVSFGTGTLISLRWIILGIGLGLIIASSFSFYNKRYIGAFIRKLIKNECFDSASAKTLEEMDELQNIGVRYAISSRGTLTRWVRCVEEDEYNELMAKKEEEFKNLHANEKRPPKFKKKDFIRKPGSMHFYIPEDMKYAADVKFDPKGTSVGAFLLVIICTVIVTGFISYVLPDLLKMLDNFITVMRG